MDSKFRDSLFSVGVLFSAATLLYALPAYAQSNVHQKTLPKNVYVAFENVFFGTDDLQLEPWLASEYTLAQHTRVGDVLEESRSITRDKVLFNMEQANTNTESNRVNPEQVEIIERTANGFCVSAEVSGEALMLGQPLQEHSTRNACFEWRDARWQVTKHEMTNVYELPNR
ncbi:MULTISPECIES: hypothetical protein [Gammaproteobacteria]|uniref:hypothetical protein n=1 Tax=Gammaproteobacteria TaxID=1236 RepID=UPI000DCFB789|nr:MULTISPECIES: hypothetical protein [Gammaproteobacteria]RTE87700.1 hypothetical protein DQX04_04845 [Aliidiomarina sp. B3213]TCZ92517.1 hypothetical protein EYQ95_00450 [Lysobacter sp. N42]